MPKLTDTQLIILSATLRRDDRGVELPANVKGGAARKTVDKLIRAGLLEEIHATGSLPVWRRDDESGPMALRITSRGRYPLQEMKTSSVVIFACLLLIPNGFMSKDREGCYSASAVNPRESSPAPAVNKK